MAFLSTQTGRIVTMESSFLLLHFSRYSRGLGCLLGVRKKKGNVGSKGPASVLCRKQKCWASRVEGGRGEASFLVGGRFLRSLSFLPHLPGSSHCSIFQYPLQEPAHSLPPAWGGALRGEPRTRDSLGRPGQPAQLGPGVPAGPCFPGRRGSLLRAALVPGAAQAGDQASAIQGAAGVAPDQLTTSPLAHSGREHPACPRPPRRAGASAAAGWGL